MTSFNIHPVVAGVIPNYFITYRLKSGVLETVHFLGGRSGNVAIEGADFSIEGGAMHQLGVGSIIITGRNNQTLVWDNVPSAVSVRDKLIKLAAGDVNEKSVEAVEQHKEACVREIPTGIEFSDTVLVFPTLHEEFNRPLWITNPSLDGKFTEFHCNTYGWIEIGDKIGTIRLRASWWKSIDPITIYSPVSGIVLYNEFFKWGEWNNSKLITLGSILLPKGCSVPEDCRLFDGLCQYLEENRTNIFLKPQEFNGRYSDEGVLKALNEQRNRKFLKRSFRTDYPELIEDILKHKPELIGRLSGSEAKSVDKNTETITSRNASVTFGVNASPERFERQNINPNLMEAQQLALRRYEISPPFSKDQLHDKWRYWRKISPDSALQQVNEDYETLLSLVN